MHLITVKKGVIAMRRSRAIAYSQRLLRRMNTSDPFELAEALNMTVIFRNDFKNQKGAFKVILGQRFIFINSNLSPQMQRIVCGHEIGHGLMHRHLATDANALMEFEIFDMTDECEYEANVFASYILLDENEIVDLAEQGYDVVQIARLLETNVNLLLVRITEMNRQGKNFRIPYNPDRKFLGTISDNAGDL